MLEAKNEMADNDQNLDIYLTETECKFNDVAGKLLGMEIKARPVKEEIEFLS